MIIKNLIKKNFPKVYGFARKNFKKITIKKTSNIENIRKQNIRYFESIKSEKYFDYKKKIFKEDQNKSRSFAYLEINNSCNINCVMCDTKSSTRQKKMMNLSLVESSLKKIKKMGINRVSLHTIGDPLANAKLDEVFKLLRKYNMYTSISTNGLLLTKNLSTLKNYIDVCSDIKFSIDGCTKETYEKIRFGGNWEELLVNFRTAKEVLEPLGYRISVLNILMKENFHEIGKFITFFGKFFDNPYERVEFDILNSLSPSNIFFENNNLFENHTYLNKFCTLVSNPIPFILVDGKLSVCCRDYDGSLVMGDTNNESIENILNSENFKDLQKSHSDENSNSFSQYNLCNTCYHIDDRITFIFINLTKMIIYKFVNKDDSFYQNKIEKIVRFLNEIHKYENYSQFEREIFT